MKIGIFDFNHYEMVYALFTVFHTDDNEITFFVNQSLHEKLIFVFNKEITVRYVIKEDNKTNECFLERCAKYIKEEEMNLLIMNSIDNRYASFYSFFKKIPCAKILAIHNVNSWFNPFFTFAPEFKYLAVKENGKPLNLLSILFNPQLLLNFFFKKAIRKNANALLVIHETIKNNLLTNHLTRLPVLVFPYSIYEKAACVSYEKEMNAQCRGRIKIVIPGSIEEKRRDYVLLLEVVEKLFEKRNDFTVVLLGKPSGDYGKKIVRNVNILKEKGYNVEHHYNENNYFESIRIMATCDIIASPINTDTNFENTREIYGETKATGVLFDMIRYAKPGILPKQLNTSDFMENTILRYRDKEELHTILIKILHETDYLENLKANALKNAENYSVSAIRSKILPEIIKIVNHVSL